jgi:hypothetical protein
MRRRLAAAAAVAVLLAAVVALQLAAGRVERPDPMGRKLLYLPSEEMLRLASLGNEGLVADLLYLWSIQYYAQFEPPETFLYLEKVYELITDLDPDYLDAYRVGAMIMEIEAGRNPAAAKDQVRALFDKGIAATHRPWELAEVAAWDGLIVFHDKEMAVHYAGIAASYPEAHPRIKRAYGQWKTDLGAWTLQDSLRYWESVVASAPDRSNRYFARHHLYDVVTQIDRKRLEPLLERFRTQTGRCPTSWQPLIDRGWLRQVPTDAVGTAYGIDAGTCTLVARKKITGD